MTRHGVSLDLGRKKIRKQKNLFDDHDLLILQLPGTLEEGMKAKNEYIRSFAGKETPLVFLCPDGFSEEEENSKSSWKNGFRLVARLTGHTVRGRPAAVFFRASQSAVQRRMESEKILCICGCIIV